MREFLTETDGFNKIGNKGGREDGKGWDHRI